MNRNTGLFTAIAVAVVAIFGFTVHQGSSGGSAGGGSEQSSHASDSKAAGPQSAAEGPHLPCREINERIAEFIPDKTLIPPESCGAANGKFSGLLRGAQQTSRLKFIIATLPDPVHTHFPMLFDRLTEALQQAAQDQGYSYDGSWLPWVDERHSYGGLMDQSTAQAMEDLREA